jgi:urocanate hydratase
MDGPSSISWAAVSEDPQDLTVLAASKASYVPYDASESSWISLASLEVLADDPVPLSNGVEYYGQVLLSRKMAHHAFHHLV